MAKRNKWRWIVLGLGIAVLVFGISEATPLMISFMRERFRGKGLWDYLDVFLVPFISILSGLLIALLIWHLERGVKKKEEILSIEREQVRDQDRKEREHTRVEAGKNQALQTYYDRVSEMLFSKQVISLAESASRLGGSYTDPIVDSSKVILRARTLSILREMGNDGEKKSSVIRFLVDSRILSVLNVSLSGADLSFVDFLGIDLDGVDLLRANFFAAKLGVSELNRSNLSLCNLRMADLTNSNLRNAMLVGSDLSGAKLYHADFGGANLMGARLAGARLLGANLSSVDLRQANLSGTTLRGVNLKGIIWDEGTIWPEPREFEEAMNINDSLKIQLGL